MESIVFEKPVEKYSGNEIMCPLNVSSRPQISMPKFPHRLAVSPPRTLFMCSMPLLHSGCRPSSGKGNGGLLAGTTRIWLCALSTNFDIDFFAMVKSSPPNAYDAYEGTPAKIPGIVQAEKFDWGGTGVGYSDSTALNAYRVSGRRPCARTRAGANVHVFPPPPLYASSPQSARPLNLHTE